MGLIKSPLWEREARAPAVPSPCSRSCVNASSPAPHRPQRSSSLRARTLALLARLRAEGKAPTSRRPPSVVMPSPSAHCIDRIDLNRVHLSGTLGSEPLLYDIGDHPVAALALASQRRWRAASGVTELETTWFNLAAWEELAEQCGRLLHRGDQVYVEGALHVWTERRGHQSYGCHTVVLDRVVLLDTPRTPNGRATDGAIPAPRC